MEQKVPGSGNQWTLLWEVDNVGYIDPHESEEPGEYPVAVSSISSLKTVDHSAHASVLVLGYFAPGDWGGPSVFNWDPACTKMPEDGAYVLPSDQEQSTAGRWVQQFNGDIIDVRKFGALPDMTENSDVTAKVVNAVRYSQDNSTRTRPITVGFVSPGRYNFVGSFNFSSYFFVDLTDNSVFPIEWYFGTDVVLNSLAEPMLGSVFTLSANTICVADKELVDGPCSLQVQGGGKICVDPAWWGLRNCTISDCYVICNSVTTNAKSFTRCHVESISKIGGFLSCKSMAFKEAWLVENFSFSNLVLTDVSYGVHDCRSADSYIAIKNSQNDSDYGDLQGKSITEASILPSSTAKIMNCSGSIVISNDTNLKINNYRGTIKTPANQSVNNPILEMKNCSVTFDGGNYFKTVYSESSNLIGDTPVKVSGDCKILYCKINVPLTVFGNLSLKNNEINKSITHSQSNVICANIISNVFNSVYTINGLTSNTVVNAIIKGNVGSVENPIQINRENLNPLDSSHTYTYASNSGTFLPYTTHPSVHLFTIHHSVMGGSETPSTTPHVLTQYVLGGSDDDTHGTPEGFIFPWYTQPLFDQIKMFRIGTDRFAINAKLTAWDRQLARPGSSGEYKYNRYHDATLAAVYIDGFTWGVMPYWNDPADMSNPLENFSSNPDFFEGSLCFTFNNMPDFNDYNLYMSIQYECLDKHL